MKITLSAAVLAVMLYGVSGVTPAFAHAGENHSGTSATVPQSAEGEGTIKAIDRDAGTVTLDHGPIATLNWPAMTMTFKIESVDILKDAAVGNKVHFTLKNQGGKPTVTELHAE